MNSARKSTGAARQVAAEGPSSTVVRGSDPLPGVPHAFSRQLAACETGRRRPPCCEPALAFRQCCRTATHPATAGESPREPIRTGPDRKGYCPLAPRPRHSDRGAGHRNAGPHRRDSSRPGRRDRATQNRKWHASCKNATVESSPGWSRAAILQRRAGPLAVTGRGRSRKVYPPRALRPPGGVGARQHPGQPSAG